MAIRFYILFLFSLLLACNTEPPEIKQNKSDAVYIADHDHHSFDSATGAYNDFLIILEKLYAHVDNNPARVLKQTDSLLFGCDTNYKRTRQTINNNMMEDLHFLKGEVLFKEKSFSEALKEFIYDTIVDYNIGRAACLLKLNRKKEALQNILNSNSYCYSGFVLGNYYEITNNLDSARAIYNRESQQDWIQDRKLQNTLLKKINEISKTKPITTVNLYIPTRRPSVRDAECD